MLILFAWILGIGDSAASIYGSKYGEVKFPNSKKTVEGMMASIVAQLVFIIFISFLFNDFYVTTGVIFSVTFSSMVEALTSQVDNVAVPLIMYLLNVVFT
jgi:dolichol kinase